MATLLTPLVTTQLMGSSARWPNTTHRLCPQARPRAPTPGPAVCAGQSVYGHCSARACFATTKKTQATRRLMGPLCSRQARAHQIKMVATCAHVSVVRHRLVCLSIVVSCVRTCFFHQNGHRETLFSWKCLAMTFWRRGLISRSKPITTLVCFK